MSSQPMLMMMQAAPAGQSNGTAAFLIQMFPLLAIAAIFYLIVMRPQSRLVLLHAALLRADHQHVEDDENQQPWKNADQDSGGAARPAGGNCLHRYYGWVGHLGWRLSERMMVGATGFEPATSTPPV